MLLNHVQFLQRNERGERRHISFDSSQVRKDHPTVKMTPARVLKITLAYYVHSHAKRRRVCEWSIIARASSDSRGFFAARPCFAFAMSGPSTLARAPPAFKNTHTDLSAFRCSIDQHGHTSGKAFIRCLFVQIFQRRTPCDHTTVCVKYLFRILALGLARRLLLARDDRTHVVLFSALIETKDEIENAKQVQMKNRALISERDVQIHRGASTDS